MKRLSIYSVLSAAALLFAAASCTPDSLQVIDGSYITLSLSSKSSARPDVTETKADTKPGEDDFNENVINDVYYFFYVEDATKADPIFSGRIAGIGQKGTSTKTEDVPVKSDIASSLFASTDSCQVFIVANPPKSMETTLGGTPTLEELRALTLETTLKDKQESFTMVFDAKAVKSADSGNIMTVEANLQRLASKMTFVINTAKTCTDAGSTWTSDPDKAKISFYNAFKKTNLIGDFEAVKKADSKYNEKYFNSDAIAFAAKTTKDSDTWSNKAVNPVYSYPQSWDFVASKEPYVLIEIPWTKSGASAPVIYYYKVFLDAKELKMNTWSHLTVNISELGSTTADDPKQLLSGMNYLVLNWNDAFESGEGITADVDDARYLMLNEKKFTLYNQNTWDIPYTSSHECTIKDISYTKINYKNGAGTPETITDQTKIPSRLKLSCNGSLILFEHELINDITRTTGGTVPDGAYDVAPYTIEFTICHNTDDPDTDALYAERISVTQYPAIYIEAQQNSCGAAVKLKKEYSNQNDYVCTAFVNILNTDGSTQDRTTVENNYGGDPYWMLQSTNLTIGNKNGHMYVLTTTTAPELEVVKGDPSTKYIIGDPRKLTVDDSWSSYRALPWLGSTATDHNPTYYYPTVTSDRAANVIAPKLRVASSWGQTLRLTYDNALRRCAAYQEDGYPAGRWRMPTAAELMYICKLSEHHMIPMLYGSASDDTPSHYWCSTGFIEVYRPYQSDYTTPKAPKAPTAYHSLTAAEGESFNNSGTTETFRKTSTKLSVRCVYDEWYWENTSDAVEINGVTVNTVNGRMPEGYYSTRIWGDRKR